MGVVSYPFANDISPSIRVAIQVHQFHAMSGGDAVLEVTWFISDGSAERSRTGNFTEPLNEDGYEGVVEAQSKLIATLADAIEKDLRSIPSEPVAEEEPEDDGSEENSPEESEEDATESP